MMPGRSRSISYGYLERECEQAGTIGWAGGCEGQAEWTGEIG